MKVQIRSRHHVPEGCIGNSAVVHGLKEIALAQLAGLHVPRPLLVRDLLL